jgi:glycosyltransferase involved in cell wall biosynthesis
MNPAKPRLAFIINDTDFFLSHRQSLAHACVKDYRVLVFLPPHPKNQKVKELGFELIEYPLQKTGLNPLAEIKTLIGLYRRIKKHRPQIIHNFTIKPALYGTLMGRLCGVPQIFVTITGLGFIYVSQSLKGRLIRPLINSLYRLAFSSPRVKVIFQNPDDQRLFTDQGFVTPDRSIVIAGSGVDPKRFFPKPELNDQSSFKILVPCRMIWDKGIGDIVQAFKELPPNHNMELWLAGQIPKDNPAAITQEQIREWEQSTPRLKWLGPVTDMNTLYNQVDLVCLPSYREGLPLSLLEASLCQKTILTTDTPGCNFLIQHNVNGWIVPPRSPQALREALVHLQASPELCQKLALQAREMCLRTHTIEPINRQIMGFYQGTGQPMFT